MRSDSAARDNSVISSTFATIVAIASHRGTITINSKATVITRTARQRRLPA